MTNNKMLENKLKQNWTKQLREMFPGCFIYHLDPNEIQGSPDLLILYKNKWAALEGKTSPNAPHQPNQDYYVELMNDMSFASFIYPENEDQVFSDLLNYFERY